MKQITRRRRRVKLSKGEILRRLRLGELRRLLRDRCGPILPDDDAGREYLAELLLPISLGPNEATQSSYGVRIWGPTDRMRAEIERWAPWMNEDEARELRLEINSTPVWQRKPKPRTLGERLNVTYAERTRLGLRTIGPCDMTEAAMALIRKQEKRRRNKLRYAQSRPDYLAASLSQTKPWEQEGISRRTWERRRVASQSHINLTKTCLLLASKEKTETNTGLCERLPTPTHAGQTPTSVNDGLLTAEEASWLVDAICPPANTNRMAA
jgi:hypothetical protein